MLKQLWYCVGWMFDPRLWGVDTVYRWLKNKRRREVTELRERVIALEKQLQQNPLERRGPVAGGMAFPRTYKVIQEMILSEVLSAKTARAIVRKSGVRTD